MRKLFIYLLFVSCILSAEGQDSVSYRLNNVNEKFALSTLSIYDSYLSPLIYSGLGVGYEHSESRLLLKNTDKFSINGRIRALLGYTLNPQFTSSITYAGLKYNWGIYYQLKDFKGVSVFGGANIGAGYGYKSNDRNVNNPFNLDIFTDLNISGVFKYDIHTRKRTINLNYMFEFPIAGCMFVPEKGASYYEIGDLGNISNSIHFSSLHNKNGMNSEIGIVIPFNYSTWSVGIGSSELKYKANDLLFSTNSVYLTIGIKYDVSIFAGKKIHVPANFRKSAL